MKSLAEARREIADLKKTILDLQAVRPRIGNDDASAVGTGLICEICSKFVNEVLPTRATNFVTEDVVHEVTPSDGSHGEVAEETVMRQCITEEGDDGSEAQSLISPSESSEEDDVQEEKSVFSENIPRCAICRMNSGLKNLTSSFLIRSNCLVLRYQRKPTNCSWTLESI